VRSFVGNKAADKSMRLFMVPGMNHCGGGEGPNQFDKVAPLEAWVESGKTPERIIASHRQGSATDRTRPLCPFPQLATYTGSGSTDDAANFVCSATNNSGMK
jgi:feruloyl esterase